MSDKIFIRDLRVNCVIGCGPDERVKRQPLVINVTLHVDIAACGDSDSLHDTVNYSAVAKRLAALVERSRCYTLEALATAIAADVLTADDCRRVESVTVRLDKPEAFAKLPAVPCVEITRPRSYFSGARQRQDSSVWRADAAAAAAAASPSAAAASPSAGGASARSDGVVTAYLAIGSNVGDRVANIKAALRLLQAVPDHAAPAAAGDDLSPTGRKRRRPFLTVKETSFLYETPPAYVLDQPPFLNGALAVETNLSPGALLAHIKANVEGAMGREKTLRFGPRNIDVDILLYGPNAVVEVPEGSGDGGAQLPLTVPHPRLAERDFALGPLVDLCPGLMHPTLHCSIVDLLARLPAVNLTRVLPLPSRPLGPAAAAAAESAPSASSSPQERLLRLGGRTHVVGILNVTPDSFSDGGEHFAVGDASAAADAAVRHAVAMVAAGADVIDVGGQSTRPGADMLPPDVEVARVVPAITAIRRALPGVPVSIDTFHAAVARAAVDAGADIINDVSGGLLDAAMLKTAAELEVPIVLMHMRGTPATMTTLAHYGPPANPSDEAADGSDVLPAVRAGLAQRAAVALAAGVPRWHVVLDPGLGFAKQAAHNFALLRHGGRLDGPAGKPAAGSAAPAASPSSSTSSDDAAAGFGLAGYPLLYGPSRKRFLGAVLTRAGGTGATEEPAPKARVWATAAAVTASIAVGAEFVRVHDVAEMRDVVDAADAIYRGAGVPALKA